MMMVSSKQSALVEQRCEQKERKKERKWAAVCVCESRFSRMRRVCGTGCHGYCLANFTPSRIISYSESGVRVRNRSRLFRSVYFVRIVSGLKLDVLASSRPLK